MSPGLANSRTGGRGRRNGSLTRGVGVDMPKSKNCLITLSCENLYSIKQLKNTFPPRMRSGVTRDRSCRVVPPAEGIGGVRYLMIAGIGKLVGTLGAGTLCFARRLGRHESLAQWRAAFLRSPHRPYVPPNWRWTHPSLAPHKIEAGCPWKKQ